MHGIDGTTWTEGNGMSSGIFPFGAFELLGKNSSIFSGLFAYYPTEKRTLVVNGQAQTAAGEYISGDYFRGLEVLPAAGRLNLLTTTGQVLRSLRPYACA
jgi:macrolide transport system ATP-binding/permease protein